MNIQTAVQKTSMLSGMECNDFSTRPLKAVEFRHDRRTKWALRHVPAGHLLGPAMLLFPS